jgi:hypothetical protein
VLWGAYHGALLVLTGARRILAPTGPARTGGAFAWTSRLASLARIPAMFVLTLIGWLLFRETELAAVVRDLRLSPFDAGSQDRGIALYLFLLTLLYSSPLWIQSIWVEWHRDADGIRRPAPIAPAGWPAAALHGLACGAAFAAILIFRSRASLDFIYFQF